MPQRAREPPSGSDAFQHAALNSDAVQPAKRNRTGDISFAGASSLADDWSRKFNVWKLLEPIPETENDAAPSLDGDSAVQPDIRPGDAPQPSSVQIEGDAGDAALEDPAQWRLHGVARAIEQDLRAYCASRAEGASLVEQGLKQLRLSVYRKAKYPVDEESWIPGAAPPGQQQYVEAFIFETHVLQHANAHLLERVSGDGSAMQTSIGAFWGRTLLTACGALRTD